MEAGIARFIRQEELVRPGERILLAVSGGADSVCLFHVMVALQEELGISLGVAHVNHGIRGAESDADEAFVRSLAREHHLLFHGAFVDVPALSRQRGKGLEETARLARYEFFEEVMARMGYSRTALAHTMNDQAETMLHRLIRGAGLNGLAGMRPLRDGRFIRPLLETRRSVIEDWLRERGQASRTDQSNLEVEYTRNRIRLELVPELMTFNPDIIGTLSAMSHSLAWDRRFLEEEAQRLAGRFLRESGGKLILEREAFSLPEALASRLVLEAVSRLKGSRQDITVRHILDAMSLAKGETGRRLDLSGGVTLYSHYGSLEFSLGDPLAERPEGEAVHVALEDLPRSVELLPYIVSLGFRRPAGSEAAALDAARLSGGLTIRRRRPRDVIQPLGMTGHKKVKSLFIDRKIHRAIRDQLPVITDSSGEIAYIYPGMMSEAFRVSGDTEKIIYITVTEKGNGND